MHIVCFKAMMKTRQFSRDRGRIGEAAENQVEVRQNRGRLLVAVVRLRQNVRDRG